MKKTFIILSVLFLIISISSISNGTTLLYDDCDDWINDWGTWLGVCISNPAWQTYGTWTLGGETNTCILLYPQGGGWNYGQICMDFDANKLGTNQTVFSFRMWGAGYGSYYSDETRIHVCAYGISTYVGIYSSGCHLLGGGNPFGSTKPINNRWQTWRIVFKSDKTVSVYLDDIDNANVCLLSNAGVGSGVVENQSSPYMKVQRFPATGRVYIDKIIVSDELATTVITLSSFTATPRAGEVILKWSTESEIDNAGFNLYRSESENGNYFKINASLISAQGSSTQGASYEFIDSGLQNRKTYYYKLEDIDLNGQSTMHGPVRATPRLIYGN